jgi:hypothetical protein
VSWVAGEVYKAAAQSLREQEMIDKHWTTLSSRKTQRVLHQTLSQWFVLIAPGLSAFRPKSEIMCL